MNSMDFQDGITENRLFGSNTQVPTGFKLVRNCSGFEYKKRYQINPIVETSLLPFSELEAKCLELGIDYRTPQLGNKRKREQFLRNGIVLSKYIPEMFQMIDTYALLRPKEERCLITLDLDICRYCNISSSKIKIEIAIIPEFLEYLYQVDIPADAWLKDWMTLHGGNVIPHLDTQNFGVVTKLFSGSFLTYFHPILLGFNTVAPNVVLRLLKESAPVAFAEDIQDLEKEPLEIVKYIINHPKFEEYKLTFQNRMQSIINKTTIESNQAIMTLLYLSLAGSKDESGLYLEGYNITKDYQRYATDEKGNILFGTYSPCFAYEKPIKNNPKYASRCVPKQPKQIQTFVKPKLSKEWLDLCDELSQVNGLVNEDSQIIFPEEYKPRPYELTSVGLYLAYGLPNIISGILPSLYNYARINGIGQKDINGTHFSCSVDLLNENYFIKGVMVDSNKKQMSVTVKPSLEHAKTIALCKEEIRINKKDNKTTDKVERRIKVSSSELDHMTELSIFKEITEKVTPILEYISNTYKDYVDDYVVKFKLLPKDGMAITNQPKTFLEHKLTPKNGILSLDVLDKNNQPIARFITEIRLATLEEIYNLPKLLKSIFTSSEILLCFQHGELDNVVKDCRAKFHADCLTKMYTDSFNAVLEETLRLYPSNITTLNKSLLDEKYSKEATDVWNLLLGGLGFMAFSWESDCKITQDIYLEYSKIICDVIAGAFFTGLIVRYIKEYSE